MPKMSKMPKVKAFYLLNFFKFDGAKCDIILDILGISHSGIFPCSHAMK